MRDHSLYQEMLKSLEDAFNYYDPDDDQYMYCKEITGDNYLQELSEHLDNLELSCDSILDPEGQPIYYLKITSRYYWMREIIQLLIKRGVLKVIGGMDGAY